MTTKEGLLLLALRTILFSTALVDEGVMDNATFFRQTELFVEAVGAATASRLASYIALSQLTSTDLRVVAEDDTALRCLAAVIGTTQ